MDKFLRPSQLNIDADSPSAEDEWDMWFNNFEAFCTAIDPELNPDKLALLKAHIGCKLFKAVKNCSTYQAAIAILKAKFVKPKSEVFARHKLATCRQQSDNGEICVWY